MRAVEISAVVLFFVLLVLSFEKLEARYVPLAALCGWLLADLFSGLVHWALDTFGSIRTPVVGPAFIRPFREHHADPQGMTRHDFVEVNGASCLGCLPLLLASFFVDGFAHALLLCTCVGILFTNQCHKWAHIPPEENSFLTRQLQNLGLVLKPSEHAKHHTPPYNTHFCTANGWLNGPLDRLLR
jgi:ubiquitin-conjugating enzyme E2 variant